jgi:LmbE family N-acetylglucosaminyl deacetylase
MPARMKILAIGAHPDDIEIFMFGALAAWRATGEDLAYAIATDGSKGGRAPAAQLRRTRTAEAKAAAAHLGVTPHFLGFIDGELVPDAPVIAALRELVASTRPDLIVTHAPNDYHGDHRALSDAVRLAASFKAPVLWADTLQGVGFMPTHYVDVTAHYALKRKAIGEHRSQDPDYYIGLAEKLNGFRASQANMPEGGMAEAYRFEPANPFVDIRDLLPPAPPVRSFGRLIEPPKRPRAAGRSRR